MSEIADYLEKIAGAARLEGRSPPIIKMDAVSANLLAAILRKQFSLPIETDPAVAVTYNGVRVMYDITTGRAVAKVLPQDWPPDYRDLFWAKYPSRKAKAFAMKALDKVAFAGKTVWADLMRGLERYINSDDVRRGYVKHPATWLNAECWKDEDGPAPPTNGTRGGGPGFFEIAAGRD